LALPVALALVAPGGCERPPRASVPLAHEAYVWQRQWSTNVGQAIARHGPAFRRIVVLAAEVAWRDSVPRLTRIELDHAALRSAPCPVALALRIGPFPGPFRSDDSVTRLLGTVATDLIQDARRHGLEPAEFQLDFDCVERQLEGYRIWVEHVRRSVDPTPLVLTALPAWLDQRAFASLVRAADGFVLQVHSLARPRHPDEPFQLCDPRLARTAVERAAKVGVPFRVALPTYGYLLAFQTNGLFLGASAEGPVPAWPPGARLRELRADPAGLAPLVAGWTVDRPASLAGVIWYRLPVEGDRLNWRWPTLAAVMAGLVPTPRLIAYQTRPQPGLVEIALENAGDADRTGPAAVRLEAVEGRVVASDGIAGFRRDRLDGGILFTNPSCRLPAGQRITIGWVRLNAEVPIVLETLHTP
jgi:hypothetical protein